MQQSISRELFARLFHVLQLSGTYRAVHGATFGAAAHF